MSDASGSTAPLAIEAKTNPRPAAPAGEPRERFRALDWLTLLVSGNTAVFLLGFSLVAGQRLGALGQGVGQGVGALPWLTGLVVRWYVPTGAGLLVAALLVLGLRAGARRRRGLLGTAALVGALLCALCVYGLYLPLLQPGRA